MERVPSAAAAAAGGSGAPSAGASAAAAAAASPDAAPPSAGAARTMGWPRHRRPRISLPLVLLAMIEKEFQVGHVGDVVGELPEFGPVDADVDGQLRYGLVEVVVVDCYVSFGCYVCVWYVFLLLFSDERGFENDDVFVVVAAAVRASPLSLPLPPRLTGASFSSSQADDLDLLGFFFLVLVVQQAQIHVQAGDEVVNVRGAVVVVVVVVVITIISSSAIRPYHCCCCHGYLLVAGLLEFSKWRRLRNIVLLLQ